MATLKEFTTAEVSRHNTPDDLWIIIDGDVYDMSTFKDLHPGGAPPLKFAAGQDATFDFFGLHRKEILESPRYARLKIGLIIKTIIINFVLLLGNLSIENSLHMQLMTMNSVKTFHKN